MYSGGPRSGNGVVIHHTGAPNAHNVEENSFCTGEGYWYDFAVTREGTIYVCNNHSGNPGWENTPGGHGGSADCNQRVGIMMHGCFGGCDSGNVDAPSEAQECSVALVMSQLGFANDAGNVSPHIECRATVCPGGNYTSGASWNDAGVTLRNRLMDRRANWDDNGSC